MPNKSHVGLLKRRSVRAAGVIAALAIAAPVAAPVGEASAQVPAFGFGGWPALGAGWGAGWGFPAAAVAIGPTVIGSAFNGGTTVVVSTTGAVGNTIASP